MYSPQLTAVPQVSSTGPINFTKPSPSLSSPSHPSLRPAAQTKAQLFAASRLSVRGLSRFLGLLLTSRSRRQWGTACLSMALSSPPSRTLPLSFFAFFSHAAKTKRCIDISAAHSSVFPVKQTAPRVGRHLLYIDELIRGQTSERDTYKRRK